MTDVFLQVAVQVDGNKTTIEATDTMDMPEILVQFAAGLGIFRTAILQRIRQIETVDSEEFDTEIVTEIYGLLTATRQLVATRAQCEVVIHDIGHARDDNYRCASGEIEQRLLDSLNEIEQLDVRAARAVNRHTIAEIQARMAVLAWYSLERRTLARLVKRIERQH